jgi:hypothetical protein
LEPEINLNPAPEAWLDQVVTVYLVGFSDALTGQLVEVNDRGVVLRVTMFPFEDTEGSDIEPEYEEIEPLLSFQPWNTIRALQIDEDKLSEQSGHTPQDAG